MQKLDKRLLTSHQEMEFFAQISVLVSNWPRTSADGFGQQIKSPMDAKKKYIKAKKIWYQIGSGRQQTALDRFVGWHRLNSNKLRVVLIPKLITKT